MLGVWVAPNTLSGVAALPWNRWQLSCGISGSFAVEWPAAFVWNQWQDSRGIGGSFAVESVAAFARNTHTGIGIKYFVNPSGILTGRLSQLLHHVVMTLIF
jgi:hypothetical protein